MLLELKKLVVEVGAKSADLSPSELDYLDNMRKCSQNSRFNPTSGQIDSLKKLLVPKKVKKSKKYL